MTDMTLPPLPESWEKAKRGFAMNCAYKGLTQRIESANLLDAEVTAYGEQCARAAVPDGMVLVDRWIIDAAETALGHFCSDLGWSDADMQAMDNLSAVLADTPPAVEARVPTKTPAMHEAVRKVLKHHRLTEHGDGVVESDLIYAVLGALSAAPAAPQAEPSEAARIIELLIAAGFVSPEKVEQAKAIAAWSTQPPTQQASPEHEVALNHALYSGIVKAAINLIAACQENLETKSFPQKYGVPYGAVNALREALEGVPPQPEPHGVSESSEYYVAGPYVTGRYAGCHAVAEVSTGKIVHVFRVSEPIGTSIPPAIEADRAQRTLANIDQWKFDIRQAMIEYGSAYKAGHDIGIKEASERCCRLIDELATAAPQQAQQASAPAESEWADFRAAFVALSGLLGQVEEFISEHGEANFETAEALAAVERCMKYDDKFGQASAQPTQAANIEAAAKTLAAAMDYPWEHMPEKGRDEMRKHAASVIRASNTGQEKSS